MAEAKGKKIASVKAKMKDIILWQKNVSGPQARTSISNSKRQCKMYVLKYFIFPYINAEIRLMTSKKISYSK